MNRRRAARLAIRRKPSIMDCAIATAYRHRQRLKAPAVALASLPRLRINERPAESALASVQTSMNAATPLRTAIVSVIGDALIHAFDWNKPTSGWSWMTATEILRMVGAESPTRTDAWNLGVAMRKLNGGKARRAGGRNLLKCPPLAATYSGKWVN